MAKKVTSPKVASQASKILKDGRYSDASKSVAGSALSQREKKSKLFSLGCALIELIQLFQGFPFSSTDYNFVNYSTVYTALLCATLFGVMS